MLSRSESEIRALDYPERGGAMPAVIDLQASARQTNRVQELEGQLEMKEQQFARKLEIATRDALEEGRRQAGGELTRWREECVAQLKGAIEIFQTDRDHYLAQVEHEVVRLALGIAERILHREVQLDPLLLSGAVRVALGQLAESTEVRLRVPAAQKEMWAEMVRLMPGLPLRPEVQADEGLRESEVILESNLGVADLSVRGQLSEIERSFFEGQEVAAPNESPQQRGAAGGKRA